jgi:hypothetical protein
VVESEDESVGVIGLELFPVVIEDTLKLLKISGLDRLGELEVGSQSL